MKNLRIHLAFFFVLLIWTTTPLTIQWSSDNTPLTSLLFRMIIGVVFCLLIMLISRIKLPFNFDARRLYLIAGLAMFGAMTLIYIAAQNIPSGWIAIIFGLSPLITGVIGVYVEPESKLSKTRIIGISLGVIGLILVFHAGLSLSEETIPGIVMLFAAVLVSATSSVLIRNFGLKSELTPMQTNTGSLIIAIPLFALVAWLNEPVADIEFSSAAILGIFYLGMIATSIGFTLYYYLLKQLPASKVALMMLITPITSLLLGNLLNNEPVITEVWLGACFVCVGLFLYEHKPKFGMRKL